MEDCDGAIGPDPATGNDRAPAKPRRSDRRWAASLVDPWIRRAFSPTNLRTTLQAMADAQHDDTDQHRVLAAHEKINTCQTKLDRYRAALDAGTDPVLVQQWITQVQAACG